jgi:nucleoside-diphosphate-sugar epimerase
LNPISATSISSSNVDRLCLVTGVTGFIGGAIVAQWLESQRETNALLLMVRADTTELGLQRVHDAVIKFLEDPSLIEKITLDNILLGDFAQTQSFLNDPRIGQITEVINSGAIATFGASNDIWPVNVDGPFALARAVVNNHGFRRFVQVGTAMCCGILANQTVSENYRAPENAEHAVPYTKSKIAIEERLMNELPHLPLVIARPSIVMGHTKFGCTPNPSLFWIFRIARALRTFTCNPTDVVDIVPVDFVASSLLLLLEKPQLHHQRFHLSAGKQYSNEFLQIEAAIAQGLNVPTIAAEYQQQSITQIRKLAPQFPALLGPCVDFIVMRAIEQYGQFAALNLTFDNSHLLREIEEATAQGVPNIVQPRQFISYAGLCALTAESGPIFEQMRFDFKGYNPSLLDKIMARLFG